MSDDQLKMLIKVLGEQVAEDQDESERVVHILITETIKFRDKLLKEAGITFTIIDTQVSLEALRVAMTGGELPGDLTSEQQGLAQIYLDRLTPFRQV